MHRFAVMSVLQFLGIGGIVLDSSLSIVQSNEVAESTFEGGCPASLIEAIRPLVQDWFPKHDPDPDLNREEYFVFDRHGRRPFVVMCALIGGAAASHYLAVAFIDLNSVAFPRRSVLRDLFGLTNAETKVARLVTRGLSTTQIAAELGSAVGTVRVQLKSTFAKTKTKRQSELAAVLGRASFLSGKSEHNAHLPAADDLPPN